ncbi:TRAP transporter small permease subunit [Thiomicrorhabdus sp. ZW0627]|uniref:TRAP transporter small permease subunit n=1 Tax=Thiomicrorhabdus sp. ZW0627 TaxID=3039774 RepID=UPI002436DDFC|nr:TRAP transporter small permease subunit [Thiomicrorhabdus sp. ZW0627]MDG6774872.1 TRAP transporter small permease subunit [Thiomicrorhabdus sp. ZW0627]
MKLPVFANRLDAFIERVGRLSAWLILFLVLLVAGNVLFRYLFHVSSVGLQELEWHLLAAIAMLGSAYTLQQGEHVRVDLFYHRYSTNLKRWMDILIPAFIILPFSFFMMYLSMDYVMQSYDMGEVSPDPGGLGYRYLVKALLPLGFLLIAVQGLALLLKAITDPQREH